MAVRRRKEVEDPNNTWNMQLMTAVINKDLKTADELLLKGAQIDHYAPADINVFPAGTTDIRALLSAPHTTLQPHGAYERPLPQNNAATTNIVGAVKTSVSQGASVPNSAPAPVNAALNSAVALANAATKGQAGAGAIADASIIGGATAPTPPLVGAVDPNSRHVTAITPFIAAILNEDFSTAAWVASSGGNPNGQFNNNRNGTVLHYLVRTDNAALLESLLSKRETIDAHLNISAKEAATRLTPIQLALTLRKPDMARILIRYGAANPFSELSDGRYNSTQLACLTGDVATLETNLSAGDDIRQKDLNGQTLMHLALLQPAVLDVLIERGSGAFNSAASPTAAAGAASGAGNANIGVSTDGPSSPAKGGGHHGHLASTVRVLAQTQGGNTSGDAGGGGAFDAAPLTLNTAYNDEGETPLIFVIKHWGTSASSSAAAASGVANSGGANLSASPSSSAAAAAASYGAAVTTSASASAAAVVGPHHGVISTASLLSATLSAAAGGPSAQNAATSLASLPQSPFAVIPVVAAGTNGYNATIAAAISMATGGNALIGGSTATSSSSGASVAGGAGVAMSAGGPEGGAADGGQVKPDAPGAGGGGGKKGDRNSANTTGAPATLGYGLPRTALELVDYLVSKGADPSAVPDNSIFGLTPLMHAVVAYSPDLIRRLTMDYKVDVNARDRTGATALHYSVSARMRGALDMLTQVEGIDLNPADRLGETPLHRASIRGDLWALNHLLALSYTDVNAVDAKGFTALHAAVKANMKCSIEALLPRCAADVGAPPVVEKGKKAPTVKKGQPPPEPPVPLRLNIEREEASNGWTALQLAIADKRHDLAKLLITEGSAKVQRPFGDDGGFLLHEAVRQQNFSMVELLISKGADVLARDRSDRTALHVACAIPNSDISIIALLLESGSFVDEQDDLTLSTPLHLAARTEHVELVELLLAHKAKPNVTNSRLETPIHVACEGADAENINTVIDGCGVRKTNVYAVKGFGLDGQVDHLRNEEDAALMRERMPIAQKGHPVTVADLRAPIPLARRDFSRRTEIVRALIAAGAQLRTNDTEGRLPLHCAAASGNVEAIMAVLDAADNGREAMLLACDLRGWTPLHSAVGLGGSVEAVRTLLRCYEALPPFCFGVKPKAGTTVTVQRSTQASLSHAQVSGRGLPPTAAAASQPTARMTAQSAAAQTPLTSDSDPVLAVLRRQDNNNRHPLLIAASMGHVEIGRLLVKYQKERVEGLKKGCVFMRQEAVA